MSPGRLLRPKFVTRQDMRANPRTLYVFGDNMQRRGRGGQAAEMRDEPNAIGIPTKRSPSVSPRAFFTDADWRDPDVRAEVIGGCNLIEAHLRRGGDVAIPLDGIGTGLAELPTRAPLIYAYITKRWDLLKVLAAETVMQ